jgi:hypothetical protein
VRALHKVLIIFRPISALFAIIQSGVRLLIRGLTAPIRLLLPAKEEKSVAEF